MPARTKSPVAYLEEDRGYETLCWIWQRATCDRGRYGRLRIGGLLWLAHRWYWTQANGPIPEGKQLDHKCGQTLCVNPAHTEPVTSAQNTRRGRKTKLTEQQVDEIRARLAAGEQPSAQFAAAYGVQTLHIWRIGRGLTWAEAA